MTLFYFFTRNKTIKFDSIMIIIKTSSTNSFEYMIWIGCIELVRIYWIYIWFWNYTPLKISPKITSLMFCSTSSCRWHFNRFSAISTYYRVSVRLWLRWWWWCWPMDCWLIDGCWWERRGWLVGTNRSWYVCKKSRF